MSKPAQNTVQWTDYLAARKLHLSGIIFILAEIKNLSARESKETKVETLTLEAIKAELDVINHQLKKKGK